MPPPAPTANPRSHPAAASACRARPWARRRAASSARIPRTVPPEAAVASRVGRTKLTCTGAGCTLRSTTTTRHRSRGALSTAWPVITSLSDRRRGVHLVVEECLRGLFALGEATEVDLRGAALDVDVERHPVLGFVRSVQDDAVVLDLNLDLVRLADAGLRHLAFRQPRGHARRVRAQVDADREPAGDLRLKRLLALRAQRHRSRCPPATPRPASQRRR